MLFTSPSTVAALDGLQIATGTVLGAIGRPTAAAVQKSGHRLDFVADRPTARALVDGLIAAVQRPESERTPKDQLQHRRVEA